jgi:hypothetical protein
MNTVNNEIDKLELPQEINKNTQAQYLNKKVVELKSKGVEFKTIANREAVQSSSIAQRAIKRCQLMFNYCPSNNSDICGISYYSKKDQINLNGVIDYDGAVRSKLEVLWSKFEYIFLTSTNSYLLCCRHFALAWVTNKLDIKNIDNLADLQKSDFLTKFAGKEATLEKILTSYDLHYTHNDIATDNINFSSTNFGKIIDTICYKMQQQKEQSRSYLLQTSCKNKAHIMALKINIINNAVEIKFYNPDDTLREQNIVFNSTNDVHNLQLKDLLDLKSRLVYRVDSFIGTKNDEKNCMLQHIPNDYSVTQNIFIKSIVDLENSIERRRVIMDTATNKMIDDSENFMETLMEKQIQYENDFHVKSKEMLTTQHERFNKGLETLNHNFIDEAKGYFVEQKK